jgi:hypothetical protein
MTPDLQQILSIARASGQDFGDVDEQAHRQHRVAADVDRHLRAQHGDRSLAKEQVDDADRPRAARGDVAGAQDHDRRQRAEPGTENHVVAESARHARRRRSPTTPALPSPPWLGSNARRQTRPGLPSARSPSHSVSRSENSRMKSTAEGRLAGDRPARSTRRVALHQAVLLRLDEPPRRSPRARVGGRVGPHARVGQVWAVGELQRPFEAFPP